MKFLRIIKWSFFSVLAIVSLFVVTGLLFLLVLSDSDSQLDEPNYEQIQSSFLEKQKIYESLVAMFQSDVTKYKINIVRSEIPNWANCNSFPCELPSAKWNKYKGQLDKIGCSWVKYENNPERIYFIMHYKYFLMDARVKGLVYTEEKYHSVSAYHPRQEWEKVDTSWYVFTMIDD